MFSEVFLTQALSGKNNALSKLNIEIAELNQLLNIEKKENTKLSKRVDEIFYQFNSLTQINKKLSKELKLLDKEKNLLSAEIYNIELTNKNLGVVISDLEYEKATMEKKYTDLNNKIESSNKDLLIEKEISEEAKRQIIILNNQLRDLKISFLKIEKALDASELDAQKKGIKITELGKRLNSALAKKVGELSKYRSEFFGKLKEIIGNREDILIVGDRFILQSEILFESGSAKIAINGTDELKKISKIVINISKTIPNNIDWLIQIQGHTDSVPISNSIYPSNWELSIARAMAVSQIMIDSGISPKRISVAGYGEYRPLVKGENEKALKKNRRIEIKLTQP